MKKELLKIPFFGWTISTLSPIAINRKDRSGSMAQILLQGAKKIQQGFWIMLYPEGTRVAPGKNISFKLGAGRIATTLKLPIIPVSHNAWYILPKHSFCLYPGIVTIIIGQAIYPLEHDTPESITKQLEVIVQTNLNTILPLKNNA
jgi:1-acyl-sn-glycerol-3-phosphate acyltransferase